jgi:hypothetical protein
MNIDDKQLKSLIRRIAEQEIRRLLEPEKTERGALAIIPAFVPDPEPVKAYLKKEYPEVTLVGEGAQDMGAEFSVACAETRQEKQLLMASLKGYADILLINPPLWMMKNIACGDDRGFYEQAFLRALLWNKNVTVVLDFEKPGFKRGTFFEGINDALSAIEGMGAGIVSLGLSVVKAEELELVTEAEVVDAHKQGRERVPCAPGAIVTPLARDRAKELGIEISE